MSDFNEAWNEYWKSGFYTSCSSGGKDAYPLALKDFWCESIFTTLKNDNVVVDLCSGGGGVPDLLMGYAKRREICLKIKVTDLASISQNIESTDKVKLEYFSHCNCEELPFSNDSFELITSSFGIEYSNLQLTFKEIFRTLKKGGICATILHCYDSEIVKNATSQLIQGQTLVHKLNFFNLFREMYLARSKSKAIQKSKEKKLLECLNKIKLELLYDNELTVYQSILNAAHDIFLYGQNNKPIKCIEYINKMEKALIYNYQRMENLKNVVLSKKRIKEIISLSESMGLKIVHNSKIKSGEGKVLGLGIIYKK